MKSAQLASLRHSPTILSGLGCAGLVATAVLSARAAYTTALILAEARIPQERMDREPLTGREELELVWKQFIPPAVVGAVTLTAIIGANRISTKRAAALAAAFKISEQMAEEYRSKVLEHIGANKEEQIRSEVAHERIGRVEGVDGLVLTGAQEIYYDSWSGRAFLATREQVEQAVNQINYQINQQWSASLSEFYDLLGLSRTAVSDEFGWNSDELLEPYYSPTFVGDRKPAVEIRYNTLPFREFGKIGI